MKYQFLGKLNPEHYQALEQSIREDGVLVQVVLDEDGHILDGHTRVEIADRLNIPYETLTRTFKTEAAKRDHVYKLNLLRRHLDPHEWGLIFKRMLEERGLKRGQGARNDQETSATIAEVAKEVGVSERTARHRVALADSYEALPEQEQEAVSTGKKSFSEAGRRPVSKSNFKRRLTLAAKSCDTARRTGLTVKMSAALGKLAKELRDLRDRFQPKWEKPRAEQSTDVRFIYALGELTSCGLPFNRSPTEYVNFLRKDPPVLLETDEEVEQKLAWVLKVCAEWNRR